jgi:hypothetical protein
MGKPTWSGQDFSKKPVKASAVKKIAPGVKDCGSPFHRINDQITDSVTQVRRYADGSPGGVKQDEPGFFSSVRDFFTRNSGGGSVSDEVYNSKEYQDDKARGLKASEDDAKVGFFERLRMGNIDDPNSEAYRRFGAGRGEDERWKARPDDGSSDRAEKARLDQRPNPAAPAAPVAPSAPAGGSSGSPSSGQPAAPASGGSGSGSGSGSAPAGGKSARERFEEAVEEEDQRIGQAQRERVQAINTGVVTGTDKSGKPVPITTETAQPVRVDSAIPVDGRIVSSAQPASASSAPPGGGSGTNNRQSGNRTNNRQSGNSTNNRRSSTGTSGSPRPGAGAAGSSGSNANPGTGTANRSGSNSNPTRQADRGQLATDSIQTMTNRVIELNKLINDPKTKPRDKQQFIEARNRIQAEMASRARAGR